MEKKVAVYLEMTSDSLNEGLPIQMTREKFLRKRYIFYEKVSRFNPRLIHKCALCLHNAFYLTTLELSILLHSFFLWPVYLITFLTFIGFRLICGTLNYVRLAGFQPASTSKPCARSACFIQFSAGESVRSNHCFVSLMSTSN